MAEWLGKAVVESAVLKEFRDRLCVASYPDRAKHTAEMSELEKNFPMYSENTECSGPLVWGDVKLGRLPEFLYQDARASESQSPIDDCDHRSPAMLLDDDSIRPPAMTVSATEQPLDAASFKNNFINSGFKITSQLPSAITISDTFLKFNWSPSVSKDINTLIF